MQADKTRGPFGVVEIFFLSLAILAGLYGVLSQKSKSEERTATARAQTITLAQDAREKLPAAILAIERITTERGVSIQWSGKNMEPLVVSYQAPWFSDSKYSVREDRPAEYTVVGVTKSGLFFRVAYALDAKHELQITADPRTIGEDDAAAVFAANNRLHLIRRFKLPLKTS